MKTIETLFDTVVLKEKRERSPETKLKSGLRSLIRQNGIYHYKIVFNRVYFGKVTSFPAGIDKPKWIELARFIADEEWGSNIVLVDKKKANQ